MKLSTPTKFESQSYALSIVEIESLVLSAQLRLQIADLQAGKPSEAQRHRTLAGTLFAEAANALARFSTLGLRKSVESIQSEGKSVTPSA